MKKLLAIWFLLLFISCNRASAMPTADETSRRTPAKHLVLVIVSDAAAQNSPALTGKAAAAMQRYFPESKFHVLLYGPALKDRQHGAYILAQSILQANSAEPGINQAVLKKDSVAVYNEQIHSPLTTVIYISTFSINAAGSNKKRNLVLRADTRTLSPHTPDYIYVNFIDSGTPKKPASAANTLLRIFKNKVAVPLRNIDGNT